LRRNQIANKTRFGWTVAGQFGGRQESVMSAEAFVKSSINYSVDNGIPLEYYLYEPGPSVMINRPGTDSREVCIYDGWSKAHQCSVDREGFEIWPFDDGFDDFGQDDAIRARLYPKVIDFVKRHMGARRVEVFDHTIRKRMPNDLEQHTDVQRPAVQLVHCDYTVKSGPQRVRDNLPGQADEPLKRRVVFLNVWKPLYRTVEELPLAMCDVTSCAQDDMLVMDLKYRDRTGEIYVMRYSPLHRWYYFPHMKPDMALLLKTYDSDTGGRARFMGHTAFEDLNTPPNAMKRESIEVRTMAFF